MMGKEAVAATKYDGITGMIWMNFSLKTASNFNKMDSLLTALNLTKAVQYRHHCTAFIGVKTSKKIYNDG